jgi:nucleoside-diphosphate-sugar epimerase/sirohydrochlorin ferrochelatase
MDVFLVFGLGYAGSSIAQLMALAGFEVHGTCRSKDEADEALLARDSVRAIHEYDGTEEALLGLLESEDGAASLSRALLARVTHVVSTAQPRDSSTPHTGGTSRHVEHASLCVDPILPLVVAWRDRGWLPRLRWVGYLSTTGVYGDHSGEWVDETTPVRAKSDRAKLRVEAETLWTSHELPVHIFRLPGIYGPHRGPIAKARRGEARAIMKENQYFSRVHVQDIAGAVLASALKPTPFEHWNVFNVSDDLPCPQHLVAELACKTAGLPPPERVEYKDIAGSLSPMARAFYEESRRVSSRRLRDLLGWAPAFPTYEEGVPLAAIQERLSEGVEECPITRLAMLHHLACQGMVEPTDSGSFRVLHRGRVSPAPLSGTKTTVVDEALEPSTAYEQLAKLAQPGGSPSHLSRWLVTLKSSTDLVVRRSVGPVPGVPTASPPPPLGVLLWAASTASFFLARAGNLVCCTKRSPRLLASPFPGATPPITAIITDNGSLRPDAVLGLRRICRAFYLKYGIECIPASYAYSDRVDPASLGGRPAETLDKALERVWTCQLGSTVVILPLFFGAAKAATAGLSAAVGRAEQCVKLRGLQPGKAILGKALAEGKEPALAMAMTDYIEEIRGGARRVLVCDHGTRSLEVHAVRGRVVTLVETMLAARDLPVTSVVGCAMERCEGKKYEFNEPMLEHVLPLARHVEPVVVAPMFFLPGRHAGPRGDIARICARVKGGDAEGDLKDHGVFLSRVIGEHPAILTALWVQFSRATSGSSLA